MINKLKKLLNETQYEKELRVKIENQRSEILELQKQIDEIKKSMDSMTDWIIKQKEKTRKITTVLATSKTLKQLREDIVK